MSYQDFLGIGTSYAVISYPAPAEPIHDTGTAGAGDMHAYPRRHKPKLPQVGEQFNEEYPVTVMIGEEQLSDYPSSIKIGELVETLLAPGVRVIDGVDYHKSELRALRTLLKLRKLVEVYN